MESLKKFVKDESGLELIEYAVLAALIVLATIIAFPPLWDRIIDIYNKIATALEGV